MKTLKILKQFLKQKGSEIWSILTFDAHHSIPSSIKFFVFTIVYGFLLTIPIYYLGNLASYAIGLPINSSFDRFAASVVGICGVLSVIVLFGMCVKFVFETGEWIQSNWQKAKRKVEENEKTRS